MLIEPLWLTVGDLAEARLRDNRVVDTNVRFDLGEIARIARGQVKQ